jgi:hypothetical protein
MHGEGDGGVRSPLDPTSDLARNISYRHSASLTGGFAMLKTLFACLLVAVVSSPTFTDDTIRVGMTRRQVEAILGEPQGRAGMHLGVQSAGGMTFESCSYDGLIVHYSSGVVTKVTSRK